MATLTIEKQVIHIPATQNLEQILAQGEARGDFYTDERDRLITLDLHFPEREVSIRSVRCYESEDGVALRKRLADAGLGSITVRELLLYCKSAQDLRCDTYIYSTAVLTHDGRMAGVRVVDYEAFKFRVHLIGSVPPKTKYAFVLGKEIPPEKDESLPLFAGMQL